MDKYDSDKKAEQMLRFQIQRNIVNLFKRFLQTVEELGDCHQESIDKMKKNLPDEYKRYADLAEYFTPQREEAIRKKILDNGNDTIRAINEELNQFEIKFKE